MGWRIAEKDAELTLELFKKFSVQIKQQSLQRIFNLETNLFPMLVDMKFKGVRVDVDKALQLKHVLEKREAQCLAKVKQVRSRNTNMGSKIDRQSF